MRKLNLIIPILLIVTIAMSFCLLQEELAFGEINDFVYLGGKVVGINVDVDGVIITSKVNVITKDGILCPFSDAKIMAGDILYSIDENIIQSPCDIENFIKDKSLVQVKIKRSDNFINYKIKPLRDIISRKNRLGLLVQDKISGFGTITYINQDFSYAALGHPIKDMQNNDIIGAKGEIYAANIIKTTKPSENKPGELNGVFDLLKGPIGNIETTSKTGIFGKINEFNFNKNKIYLANREEVKLGKAKIYCTTKGDEPEYFDIEIIKASKKDDKLDKSMIIKITDEKLLNNTGGIVQGMSGSPIIQNNKIIGAVTHVFVQNPEIGYGIYIDLIKP